MVMDDDDGRARAQAATKEETARYRRAAEETLEQLDWCVKYLYRIRKGGIARTIEENHSTIRRHMSRGED
jgi:hypothetical protein